MPFMRLPLQTGETRGLSDLPSGRRLLDGVLSGLRLLDGEPGPLQTGAVLDIVTKKKNSG